MAYLARYTEVRYGHGLANIIPFSSLNTTDEFLSDNMHIETSHLNDIYMNLDAGNVYF